jgi:hypothetical protein
MMNVMKDFGFGLARGLGIYFFDRNNYTAVTLATGLGAKSRP